MHRMIFQKHLLVIIMALAAWVSIGVEQSNAQPPVRHADADYDASGYVVPAGMVHPSMYRPTAAAPMGVAQVGFHGGCDAGCDGMGGCDSCSSGGCSSPATCDGMGGCGSGSCGGGGLFDGGIRDRGCGSCGQNCGGRCGGGRLFQGGLMGQMRGGCGCGKCGNCLSKLRSMCMFCRGGGCSACQLIGRGYLLGALGSLMPYTEGGLCSQRWYDISAEALFLGRTQPGIGVNTITQLNPGAGTPVITAGSLDNGGLEEGFRLSGSMIFGAGGNIEATYMGNQEWKSSSTFSDPATLGANPDFGNVALPITDPLRTTPFIITSGAQLFSFISDFGVNPAGGFDDTDRSISQSVSSRARFHSGELNYRRRTVGPYCRFQGSWLVGLRYLSYDNQLGLGITGLNNDGVGSQNLTDGTLRFFSATDNVKNDMFGAQIGGDLWWNISPGISLGMEVKTAWLKNEARREYGFTGNSLVSGGPGSISDSFREDDGTLAAEIQTKFVYRLSKAWAFRTAHYLVAMDEVGTATFDGDFIASAANSGTALSAPPRIKFDSLVLNGFSFGAEYIW
ncbi:MAG: hypothetical protein AB8B91_20035 [Rubripirellula sp.]